MKAKMSVAVLSVIALGLGLTACGLGHDDPDILVLSPKYGEEFKIGDTVNITWECRECDHIVGRTVRIVLFPDGGGQIPFSYQISEEFLTGSLSWRAGKVWGGTVRPGFYLITFSTECTDQSSTDEFWCTAQSGLFKLTN